MAQRRIERKDLVAPDAFTEVIKESEELAGNLTKIVSINKELLKSNPLKSGKDIKDFNNDIKSTVKATEDLSKVQEQLAKSTDDEVKGRLRLQRATKAQRDELRDLIVQEDRQAGTLEKLAARNRQLRRERERLNLETDTGRKRLVEINRNLDANNKRIKENSDALKQQRLNVGNYTESVEEALNENTIFGQSLSGLTDSLAKFANPLTAAVAGVTALFGAYASSTLGARDLRQAQAQLNLIFNNFGNSLARLVGSDGEGQGLFSRFATQVLKVINPALGAQGKVTSELVEQQDKLRVSQAEANREARILFRDAERLRNVRDDELNSLEDRIAANNQLLDLFNKREEIQSKVLRDRIRNTQQLLAFDQDNRDLQIELIQLEEELADIQEENEGFRAEQLANVNSLRREGLTLIERQKKLIQELDQVEDEDFLGEALADLENLTKQVQESNKEIIEDNEKEAMESVDRLLEYKFNAFEEETDAQKESLDEQRKNLEEYRRDVINGIQGSLGRIADIINAVGGFGSGSSGGGGSLGAFVSSLAGFYEGTENVGESLGKPALKGKDGHIVRVDGSERIMTGAQNAKIGAISNDDLANIALQYRTGNLASSSPINDDRKVMNKLDQVIKAVKASGVSINIDENAIVTEERYRNGLKQVTKKRPKRI